MAGNAALQTQHGALPGVPITPRVTAAERAMGWGWDPPPPPSRRELRAGSAPPSRAAAPRCPPGCRGAGAAAALPYAEPHAKGISCNKPFLPPPPHPGTPAACGVTPPSPLGFWGGHPNHEPDPPPKSVHPSNCGVWGAAGDGGVPTVPAWGKKAKFGAPHWGQRGPSQTPNTASTALFIGSMQGKETQCSGRKRKEEGSPSPKNKHSWGCPRPA